MNRYISDIKINNLYHIKDLDIQIEDENAPHLILTGKSGSGKTVLLKAIKEYLDNIKDDVNLHFLQHPESLNNAVEKMKRFPTDSVEFDQTYGELRELQNRYDSLYRKVGVSFANRYEFINDYHIGKFIIAYYPASRKTDIIEPKNPTKPNLSVSGNADKNLTSQLLIFLSDLKIQEALARNENLVEDADKIRAWLENFEKILGGFFEDPRLKLIFNYRDYSFTINTKGKAFKFVELSDGFIGILDVVVDLILKMQASGKLTTEFVTPGIVLIDEIEAHLHLDLQKMIMPMFTALFPNIQFIVTTHSPFVLNSIPNATTYELE